MAPIRSLLSLAIAAVALVSGQSLNLKVTGPASVNDISDLKLTTTLRNTGSSSVTLIKDPRSALSSTRTQTFRVFHESGAQPVFTGLRMKYSLKNAAVNPASVTTLAPGASIAVEHALGDAFNFTTSGAGAYEITPSTRFHVVSDAGVPEPVDATLENSHNVQVGQAARLAVSRPASEKRAVQGTVMKRATFSSCLSSEESEINTAITNAVSYVSDAVSYLNSQTSSTTRFDTWFGTFSSTTHTTILNHFQSLQISGSYTDWEYDCTCAEANNDTFAYVHPQTFGVINLCPQFWNAPATGEDSQAGTLVHESTHFDATAATQDFAYGQDACKSLAMNNPSQAIENAESHEYFAENTPALS